MVRILKHPLHLMLIHFPSALLPMDLVCYAAYYFMHDASFGMASFYALGGAVVSGWISVLFGALDMISISPERAAVMKKALLHGAINTTLILVYTVLAFRVYKQYPQMQEASLSVLVVKAVLVSCLFVGNYIGGSLVLKHKLGVEE